MPSQLTTRQQVNGYRFLIRRLEHALIRRDIRMLHDPMRAHTRALLVGFALAVLITAGAAVWGLIKPVGSLGNAAIVVGKESGGLYVVVGDTVHPVLNLASARLITGSNEKPTSVKESKLADHDRGPMIGIPGAPQSLSVSGDSSYWTVCDTLLVPAGQGMSAGGASTAVIVGQPETGASTVRELKSGGAILVSVDDTDYLIYDGKRAVIDDDDAPVLRALGLDQVTPRPISAGLLGAIPEVPELASPDIDRKKTGALGLPVGSIAQVDGLSGAPTTLYAVLPDGLQKISPLVADVLRFGDTDGKTQVKTISAGEAAGQKLVTTLPVGHFPETASKVASTEAEPVTCFGWHRGSSDAEADIAILTGQALPVPEGREPTSLVSADGAGPNLDEAYVPPSNGYFVRMTGSDVASRRAESLVYVADAGVRFGVPDAETGKVLGLGENPGLAPWPIVSLLVPGTTLSQTNALVVHDTLIPEAGGQEVAPPGD